MSINNGNGSKPNQPTIAPELVPLAVTVTSDKSIPDSTLAQSVILRQSPIWSRAILWTIVGVTTSAVVWACVAKIDEAIPAQGQIEPQGAVKEVQVPTSGVVKTTYVEDGQRVNRGDKLLSFDPTVAQAQLASLKEIAKALKQENQFYRDQLSDSATVVATQAVAQLKLLPELASLTKSRAALIAENQLYRTQISGSIPGVSLSLEQKERLESNRLELNSRVAADRLEVEKLEKQLSQNQVQLANARSVLASEQGILHDFELIFKQGGLERVQFLKQQQEVGTRQAAVEQLVQEQARLQFAITQAQEKTHNTIAASKTDLLSKMAENEKKIAEIDSQFNKVIVENEKRIAEIESQISQAELTVQYQDIKSPVDGTVFDLKVHTLGFVANSSEPVLKIVPDNTLTAKVFITNRDIGFVKPGMKVDVRIDSFPFSEFGDIKGDLVWVGSDALPPTQARPFYNFPAKIRLEHQSLLVNGREIPLQSGMSISANIKIRKRTIMSIFTDLFAKKIQSLQFMR